MAKITFVALASAALLFLTGDSYQSREEYAQQYVNEVAAEYGISTPQILFVETLSFSDIRPLGLTRCTVRSRECEIVLDRCVMYVPRSTYENLLAHEIAHVINFKANGLADHGREWKEIVRDLGFVPQQSYAVYNRECL